MFINQTESIGLIVGSATETTTGSLFATLLLILIVLIAICIMFGIALEFIAILILPLTLSFAAYYTNFVGPLGVLLIYLAIIFTKNWIFK